MAKKTRTLILRIILFVGAIVSLYFVPWPIVKAWIAPLPNSVQEQVNRAEDYGFDGIIVCINKKGSQTELYTSGYKNREKKFQQIPMHYLKLLV